MTNRYTQGASYRVGHIDTANEIIPQTSSFKARADERHIFEEKQGKVNLFQVLNALERGHITELDKTILSIVAVFASAACTTRAVTEMLALLGVDASKAVIESSIKRLHRLHLINLSRFQNADGTQPNIRIITLMQYGSQLAHNLGVPHKFNPMATATSKPYSIKSRAETTQLICNWLKNLPVESFEVRPVKVVDADNDAIIRPAATITVWGDKLFFEVPRRHDGWLEDITEKFKRYTKVFAGSKLPTVIVNGEDVEMNYEIYKSLNEAGYSGDVLFTEDLSMFGKAFQNCLYTFNANRVVRFSFSKPKMEAV